MGWGKERLWLDPCSPGEQIFRKMALSELGCICVQLAEVEGSHIQFVLSAQVICLCLKASPSNFKQVQVPSYYDRSETNSASRQYSHLFTLPTFRHVTASFKAP